MSQSPLPVQVYYVKSVNNKVHSIRHSVTSKPFTSQETDTALTFSKGRMWCNVFCNMYLNITPLHSLL